MQYSDYGFKFGNADEAAATKGDGKKKIKKKGKMILMLYQLQQ